MKLLSMPLGEFIHSQKKVDFHEYDIVFLRINTLCAGIISKIIEDYVKLRRTF